MKKTKWGNWVLHEDGNSLHLFDGVEELYWMDLHRIHRSSQMLDWIFQVNMKAWATSETMKDLLDALNDIFDPQQNLCSFGSDKILPKGFLER